MCSTLLGSPGATRTGPALSSQRPVWQLSDAEVESALADLEAAEARLVARRAELVREADQRSMKDRSNALSTERWLQDRFRLSRREAQGRVAQAELLAAQPVARTALAEGRLTPEQATVVATTLARLDTLDRLDPQQEEAAELLLHQAAALDPRSLAAAGQRLVEHLTRSPSTDDPADAAAVARELAAAEAAAQRAGTNSLVVKRRPDGALTGRFTVRPADVPVLTAWFAQADRRHLGTDGFEDDRPRDQRRGDHLVASLRAGLTSNSGSSGEDDQPATRLHVHVKVTTSLDALRDGLIGVGLLDTGGTLSASELRRLACTAGITPLVLGGPSEVLDLGRTRRAFSPAQVRALAVRDRGCIAPGCDRAPADCDAHHQTEWNDHGPTDLDNGALLCEHHHQQVHRQGWRVALARNGYPHMVPPVSIDPERRPRQHHRFQLTQITSRRRT